MERGALIFEKLKFFMEEGKLLVSSKSNLFWIERIIDFINSEVQKIRNFNK